MIRSHLGELETIDHLIDEANRALREITTSDQDRMKVGLLLGLMDGVHIF